MGLLWFAASCNHNIYNYTTVNNHTQSSLIYPESILPAGKGSEGDRTRDHCERYVLTTIAKESSVNVISLEHVWT